NISAVDVLNQDEENPVVSITFASETAEDFVNTRKSDTSVTGSQITDVGFYGDIRDIKDESSISTSFAEESVFSQREQEEMTSSIIPVLNEMETETEVTASTASGNSKNLTLSSLKKKVTLKWHSKLDDLSSPRELADYIRDRTEVFSFIINENFCETSTFCENCYAMRMDMEMLSEKFERLTHTTGRKVNGEKTELCVDDLQNSLNEKESEISLLVASVLKLTKENEQLIEENEFAKKDAENRKLIFEESLNKSNEEIIMLKQKLFNSEVSLAALKEEKSKPCTEDISLVKKYQTTEHMEQELEKAHRMLEDNAIKIKELENERQKDAEERKELLAKFEQALINLDVARSSRVEAIERGHTSAICSLEAKIAELSSKIDESNHRREEELLKQKSFLTETLNSLLAQIKNDVKDKYNSDWDLEDIESSLTYFEKALDIISHGASQFELLVQVVAERRMAAEGHLKQVDIQRYL
ncbi:unnamed protein product, partial [Thelazia callipaeda]|uniref:Girdin n=1 Tax=Thelazia callipaeda TaxID=103827 RepID=A0A0N5D4U5_THECL